MGDAQATLPAEFTQLGFTRRHRWRSQKIGGRRSGYPQRGVRGGWATPDRWVPEPAGEKPDSWPRDEAPQHSASRGQMTPPPPPNGPQVEEGTQLNRRNGEGPP